ncbi:hypothetical protein Y032_0006g2825 [Ancylostoma ceylanicum]|nr:hypothetical protein Y032_0006g2825 [Ancylostoma ceylanicum]
MGGIVLARHHTGIWWKKTYTITFVAQCAWILFSYLNPLLLITLNKTVRNKLLVLITSKKEAVQGTTLFVNRDASLRPSRATGLASSYVA